MRQIMATPLENALWMTKGQPHLREGVPILCRRLATFAFAVLHAVLVAWIAHDLAMCLVQEPEGAKLFRALPWAGWLKVSGDFERVSWIPYLLSFIPLFFAINIGWVLFAEMILFPDRSFWKLRSMRNSRTLLAGLMGVFPLWAVMRLRRNVLLPDWVEVRSTWLSFGPRSASPLLAQFYTAARFAMADEKHSADAELALAKAINQRGEEIWDGLGSYFLVPGAIAAGVLVLGYLAGLIGVFPLFSHLVSIYSALLAVAFIAFAKAGFGALLIDSMRSS